MDGTPDIGEGQKQALISSIQEIDKRSFNDWLADPQSRTRLDLPKPALRHLLIPSRVLELADDPTQVGIVVREQSRNELNVLIVEHRSSPITVKESLERHMQDKEAYHQKKRVEIAASGSHIIFSPEGEGPAVPSDVDSLHVVYYDLIKMGILGLNDYIINRIMLRNDRHPELLYVGDYSDREELRSKGIATSFYTKLRKAATNMGFKYLTGLNNRQNVGYFKDKLGRVTLGEIKAAQKSFFIGGVNGKTYSETMTIDFLDPNLKAEFVEAPVRDSN